MTAAEPETRRDGGGLVLVTVTYADRIAHLGVLLERVLGSGEVDRAVVVSNASRSPLEELEARWGERIDVVRLATNTGSAEGYATGIARALALGADELLLMDDDNAPRPGCVAVLREALSRAAAERGAARAMVVGLRADHQPDVARGVPAALAYPPPSSFLGFHVAQVPFKLWRRRPWARSLPPAPIAAEIEIPFAPYGGLMGTRAAFEATGLPRRDFVLYADDTEYTLRFVAAGGTIRLITGAEIEDLEPSWNTGSGRRNAFEVLLREGGDLRVYYSLRNRTWIDRHMRCADALVYALNKRVFTALLRLFARTEAERRRARLIERAIADGEAGRLGLDPAFPISAS